MRPKPLPIPANTIYRYRKDKSNFEGIIYEHAGDDIVIRWIADGDGQARQPVGTIHKGRVIVTWLDATTVWSMPVRVEKAAKMKVVLAKG